MLQPRLPLDELVTSLFGGAPRARNMDPREVLSLTVCEPNHLLVTDQRIAERCGVSQRTVQRWWHEGVPLREAEAACDRNWLHPAHVWGGEYASLCLLLTLEAEQREGRRGADRGVRRGAA